MSHAPVTWGAVERTPEGGLVMEYAQPATPLSTNQERKVHWAVAKRDLTPWRDVTLMMTRWALAKLARTSGAWRPQPVTIQVELAFRTAQRRDPHNYVGTVVKATVDGLVRGGLIPDDTPEWATILEPTILIQRDKAQPLKARVTITPRSNP